MKTVNVMIVSALLLAGCSSAPDTSAKPDQPAAADTSVEYSNYKKKITQLGYDPLSKEKADALGNEMCTSMQGMSGIVRSSAEGKKYVDKLNNNGGYPPPLDHAIAAIFGYCTDLQIQEYANVAGLYK